MFLLRVEATHNRSDVVQLRRPLAQQATVKLLEIVVWFARLRSGRQQHVCNTFQVLDTESGGDDGVTLTDSLSVFTVIRTARICGGETQVRFGILFPRPLIQSLLFFVRRPGAGNGFITPHRGPLVVWS